MDVFPYLIFHPQLCLDPRHADIQAYRGELFASNESGRIEVMTLNWARGFKLGEKVSMYGGSTIYLKSDRFDRTDEKLHANHARGLYYADWHERRTSICVLNFDEYVFLFRAAKVHSHGKAVLSNRTGPEMLGLWKWDDAAKGWSVKESADDGFTLLCDSYQDPSLNWCSAVSFTTVDRERLLTLSAGKLAPRSDWHKVENIDSFVAEQDERTKRLTFVQEQAADSVTFRDEYLGRYIKLQTTILPNKDLFPANIADLKEDFELSPPTQADGFRFNLKSKSGTNQGATAIFVGTQPPGFVAELRDKLVTAWKAEYARRLAIWFEHQGQIKVIRPSTPTISDESEHPASIARKIPT